jgi:hypothetical protein
MVNKHYLGPYQGSGSLAAMSERGEHEVANFERENAVPPWRTRIRTFDYGDKTKRLEVISEDAEFIIVEEGILAEEIVHIRPDTKSGIRNYEFELKADKRNYLITPPQCKILRRAVQTPARGVIVNWPSTNIGLEPIFGKGTEAQKLKTRGWVTGLMCDKNVITWTDEVEIKVWYYPEILTDYGRKSYNGTEFVIVENGALELLLERVNELPGIRPRGMKMGIDSRERGYGIITWEFSKDFIVTKAPAWGVTVRGPPSEDGSRILVKGGQQKT